MKNYLFLIVLSLPLGTVACAQNSVPQEAKLVAENSPSGMFQAKQSSSYIVTAKNEASVRQVYGSLGIQMLRALGNQQFEIQLQQDVGIQAVSNLAQHSNGAITAVQPNYRYQTN